MQRKNLMLFMLLLFFNVIESHFNIIFGQLTTTQKSITSDENESFIDNRIDEIPTYVPPTENLLKKLVQSVEILTGKTDKNSNHMEKFIAGITGPIVNIFKPADKPEEKALSCGFGEILNLVTDHFQAIYPGTLWCGAGQRAASKEDIGFFKTTDACCRNHDQCKDSIGVGKSSKGLRNDGIFTRSHCDCDNEFYNCLKSVGFPIGMKIGFTYFNILSPQCFKEEYPATCVKFDQLKLTRRKCLQYEMDISKNMTMQWFDQKDFI